MAIAASIQVDACTTNFLVQEHNEVNDSRVDGKTVIGRGYFADPFVLDDEGYVATPEGPGLGVDIDPDQFEQILAKPWQVARG